MTPSSSSLPDLEKLRWGYNWFMILAVYILAHCANFVVKIWTALFQTHRRGNQTDIAAKLIFISKSRKNKVNEVSNWLKNSTIFTVTELMICEESIADGAVGKKAKPCQSIDERDLGLMDGIYRKMYPQKRSAKKPKRRREKCFYIDIYTYQLIAPNCQIGQRMQAIFEVQSFPLPTLSIIP